MEAKEKHKDSIAEAFANPGKVTNASAQDVCDVLLKHKQTGNPVIIWRDRKIVWLKPEEIPVHS
ncbi:MAG: hypothetical protein NG784_02040 [Candidatus Jettenia sp.]|nr:hypothetical protein [Candidatus Jettenia sp.]